MLKKILTVRNLVILLVSLVVLFGLSSVLGLKVPPPEVNLRAEPVIHIGGFVVSNALLTSWIVMVILIVLALVATRHYPKDLSGAKNGELVPSGLGNFVEWMIEGLYGFSEEVAGRWVSRFFPIIMTIFLFIVFSNWIGLVPGVRSIGFLEHPAAGVEGFVTNGRILTATPAESGGSVLVPILRAPSTDLNFTVALALVAVFMAQYFGVAAQKLGYFKKFADFSGFQQGAMMGVIQLFVGVLELISEVARIISYSFRLFGNIFAGEVLLAVLAFLIPYIVSIPFYALELFVGFIQAFVFMMLALVFFSLSTQGHGSEAHH